MQFPRPGDRRQKVQMNYPGLPRGTVEVRLAEVDRRQNHISQIDLNNPLLLIALDCLKDRDVVRPSAHHLCERVVALKEGTEYKNAQDQITSKQESSSTKEDRNHAQQVKRLQEEKDHIVRQYREETQRLEREKVQAIEEKVRQLRRVNQQIEESEKLVADFERRVIQLEQQLSQKEQPQTQHPNTNNGAESRATFNLSWREEGSAPYPMGRVTSNAVVRNSMVYFVFGRKSKSCLCAYDAASTNWSPVPDCLLCSGFAVLIINGLLTTIGELYSESIDITNQLFSLTGKGSSQKWTEEFPPMPTKRYCMTAVCTGTALIVAGGKDKEDHSLKTVEVMNTDTHQWYTAANLPEPLGNSLLMVSGDHIYVLGGWTKGVSSIKKQPKSVYSCSLSTLLFSCTSAKSLRDHFLLQTSKGSIWNKVADLPVTHSTYVCLHGRLLAIGGDILAVKHTTAIHVYSPTTDSWEVISHMATPRAWCLTAVLPDNQLMVVGGETDTDCHKTDSVEIAIVNS